jgi:DNA gyrase inhibitor GyrI
MTENTASKSFLDRVRFLSGEIVLGTLMAALSILIAVSAYQSSMADSDQTKFNVQGQQMLTNANAEYLTANQLIGYDYSLYDSWYTSTEDDKAQYFESQYSEQLQNSLTANKDDPFNESYYTAMYAEPQKMFDEADLA